jgi:hypothetical protein
VVRINEPRGRHSAGFRPVSSGVKRMSRMARLAEGEEPRSNPLRAFFNDLRTTQIAVDVDWRIFGPALVGAKDSARGEPVRGLKNGF